MANKGVRVSQSYPPIPGQIPLMAAPGIILQMGRDAGLDLIAMDVAQQLQKMAIRFDQNEGVTTTEQGAVDSMLPVEPLRINTIEVTHIAGDISFGCSHQDVVAHEAVSGHLKLPQCCGFPQDFQKCR